MKKPIVLLSLLSFLLSGCIELVEEIIINTDRSGSVTYRVETNEAGTLLNNFTGLFDVSIEEQLDTEALKFIKQLETQPGINNLEYKMSIRSGEYYIKFDFENYRVFNEALYAVSGNKKTWFSPSYLKVKKHRLKKLNFSPWLKKYIENEKIELPSPMLAGLVSFSSRVHAPQVIKKVRPPSVIVNGSEKETEQNFLLIDILENKVNTSLRIKY